MSTSIETSSGFSFQSTSTSSTLNSLITDMDTSNTPLTTTAITNIVYSETTETPCSTQQVYTQAEQEAIVNARNEAAAKEIAKIKNNTKAALDALVII